MPKWTVQHVSSSRLSSDLIKSTCRVTYLFFLWTLYLTKEIWFFGSLEGPATTGHMGNQGSHIQQRQIGSLQYVQKTTHRYKCLRQHTMRHRSTIMQLYIYFFTYTYNNLYIYMHTIRHRQILHETCEVQLKPRFVAANWRLGHVLPYNKGQNLKDIAAKFMNSRTVQEWLYVDNAIHTIYVYINMYVCIFIYWNYRTTYPEPKWKNVNVFCFLGCRAGWSYADSNYLNSDLPNPKPSMYGMFIYIYDKNQPNVGTYTVHTWREVRFLRQLLM